MNGIRQMLPLKKWPLIVLHNRRVTGNKMDEEVNKTLVEKWKNADALYPTPTGSNDDWSLPLLELYSFTQVLTVLTKNRFILFSQVLVIRSY